MPTLAENLEAVRLRIHKAAVKAGRPPESVRLVAVSKNQPAEKIQALHAAGQPVFGENRIQEALEKIRVLEPGDLRWHFIGHLQKNKVKSAVGLFERIHSVDSVALAESIHEHSRAGGWVTPILMQVNVSGEASKFGLAPEDLEDVLAAVAGFDGVAVRGLMTIPPFDPDPENSRPWFRRLRELRDTLRTRSLPGVRLDELSMGMSNDFEVAIEEGATWVRVGTALFGARES